MVSSLLWVRSLHHYYVHITTMYIIKCIQKTVHHNYGCHNILLSFTVHVMANIGCANKSTRFKVRTIVVLLDWWQ